MFALTLNGITVSDRCASSTTVVLNAKLLDWNRTMGNKDNWSEWLWRGETINMKLLSESSLCTRWRVYYIFQWSMQSNRNMHLCIYASKKHPFPVIPQQSTQKRSKIAITDMRQKPVNFFILTHRNNFVILGSFAKTSVPVQSIIPCIE